MRIRAGLQGRRGGAGQVDHGSLRVRPATDRLEREADHMAQEALRPPETSGFRAWDSTTHGTGSRLTAGAGAGEPLPEAVRVDFESRFGYDFSGVRVHGDSRAACSAQRLGASAYTAGRDIVFGQGQFAPTTAAGRDLLAHELAHVIQQDRADVAPSIQRRLLVTGEKSDADGLLRVLEAPSGLELKRNAKTGEVTATVKNAKPPSPALAGQLLSIINNAKQDAEILAVHADPKGMNIQFGAFPDDPMHPVQVIRMDQILAFNKGVPGGGAFKLAHEIAENFETHDPARIGPYQLPANKQPKDLKPWIDVHEEDVHKLAEAAGNAVATELIGPGERQAMFKVLLGKPPKEFFQTIEDMANYFLVWDEPAGGGPIKARKAARKRVSTRTISGFAPGSIDFSNASFSDINDVAAAMTANPTATAVIEAFAAGGKSPSDDKKLALKRAFLIETLVIDAAKNRNIVFSLRFVEKGNSDKSRNEVVVTVDRPD